MLTIEKMKEIGANTEEGLNRCMNNEAFYLRMVNLAISDDSFDQLKEAIEAGDLDRAFERAHAIKGVLGNVSLTNLFEPVSEMTELLRSRTDTDYSELLDRMFEELNKYRSLDEEE
ncbi:MAG: Hpt domain-containing protein [Oscillospiraceae bacterium]|nr:Hpt domain-containing protein [Oscillospiraceae bacterium]MBR0450881.1 Hpt domain-containing protein [Oscillospiraceae bacterium]